MLIAALAALLIAGAAIVAVIARNRRRSAKIETARGARIHPSPLLVASKTREIFTDLYAAGPCSTRTINPSPLSPAYLRVPNVRQADRQSTSRPPRRRVLSASKR